ncbi:hypothetical protein V5T82_09855 [Magnetovibrio sp. PR-2]|uniref:hypothetical protein n=1 Tax=Magnetovibrio sp. PR-2 TaxID=3120356 RepID=UPI002FCE4609
MWLRVGLSALVAVVMFFTPPDKVHANETIEVLQTYYTAPDPNVALRLLKDFDAGMFRDARRYTSVIVGFCAAIFREQPEYIASFTLSFERQDTQLLVGYALTMAGKRDLAVDYLQQSNINEALIAELKFLPQDIKAFHLTVPVHLDFLLGASYATGDGEYINRILDYVAVWLDADVFPSDDVMKIVGLLMGKQPSRKIKEVLSQHKQVYRTNLYMTAAGIYYVGQNSAKHKFMQQTLFQRIASAPRSALSNVFTKYRMVSDLEFSAPQLPHVSTYKIGDIEFFVYLTQNYDGAREAVADRNFRGLSKYVASQFTSSDNLVVVFDFIIREEIYGEISLQITEPSGFVNEQRPFPIDGKGYKTVALELFKLISTTPGPYTIAGTYSTTDGRQIKFSKKFVITGK